MKQRTPDLVVDAEGRPQTLPDGSVNHMLMRALEEADLLAALVRLPSGDLAFKIFEERPRQEVLDALESAARAYRLVLRGHA